MQLAFHDKQSIIVKGGAKVSQVDGSGQVPRSGVNCSSLSSLIVVGVTPQEFIGRTALPRPRDLMHFVKASISSRSIGGVNLFFQTPYSKPVTSIRSMLLIQFSRKMIPLEVSLKQSCTNSPGLTANLLEKIIKEKFLKAGAKVKA